MPHLARDMHEENTMKLAANLLKISLLLALLPASASAVTITISAPSDSATEITLTATGTYYFPLQNAISFSDIGDYIGNDGPDDRVVNLSAGILANGAASTITYLDTDAGGGDDFWLGFSTLLYGSYTVSGSATADLSTIGHTFGQLNIGTYESGGNSLIVQYSSVPDTGSPPVPDTGSTAVLLGAGIVALSLARRRLV
ncbi:VPDSG-CTERM sorting domain-containing protein [Candidatus Pelagisphaera phototrophica]|uniref:VPDSG-CTERM sorting domain-containing protein n=1 Tax=Candidatus Pelagisphaera phototrophica TaxID=2684113 RepID=UPI0019E599E7|nr:VPDSG-CTERM sorting domain-containing protein [Candidatus Pelagisphaera phototrophica]QXD32625.1 VPDSG-CTERM sorting domain-containing protein [Candidatus Pelagisphaera phototrophica]